MSQLFELQKQDIPASFLHERYIVPPFSVFNTHQPYWKERLLKWRDLGLYGANGRDAGKAYDNRRIDKRKTHVQAHNGTSSFNPVVCEVVYKWFLPKGNCTVIDPFAGGIVRGAIAAVLGENYIGFDISSRQVKSNYETWESVQSRYNVSGSVEWIEEDCRNCTKDMQADLIFTCPPYYNLEVYTDLPDDLSTKGTYEEFLAEYEEIIRRTYSLLKDNRFSVWVVSDVRDKKTTEYYGLVADTIKLHQKAGFKFYNEIILCNETGNLAITSGDYLDRARKVGRQHQNILVFYKGDTKEIRNVFDPVYQ